MAVSNEVTLSEAQKTAATQQQQVDQARAQLEQAKQQINSTTTPFSESALRQSPGISGMVQRQQYQQQFQQSKNEVLQDVAQQESALNKVQKQIDAQNAQIYKFKEDQAKANAGYTPYAIDKKMQVLLNPERKVEMTPVPQQKITLKPDVYYAPAKDNRITIPYSKPKIINDVITYSNAARAILNSPEFKLGMEKVTSNVVSTLANINRINMGIQNVEGKIASGSLDLGKQVVSIPIATTQKISDTLGKSNVVTEARAEPTVDFNKQMFSYNPPQFQNKLNFTPVDFEKISNNFNPNPKPINSFALTNDIPKFSNQIIARKVNTENLKTLGNAFVDTLKVPVGVTNALGTNIPSVYAAPTFDLTNQVVAYNPPQFRNQITSREVNTEYIKKLGNAFVDTLKVPVGVTNTLSNEIGKASIDTLRLPVGVTNALSNEVPWETINKVARNNVTNKISLLSSATNFVGNEVNNIGTPFVTKAITTVGYPLFKADQTLSSGIKKVQLWGVDLGVQTIKTPLFLTQGGSNILFENIGEGPKAKSYLETYNANKTWLDKQDLEKIKTQEDMNKFIGESKSHGIEVTEDGEGKYKIVLPYKPPMKGEGGFFNLLTGKRSPTGTSGQLEIYTGKYKETPQKDIGATQQIEENIIGFYTKGVSDIAGQIGERVRFVDVSSGPKLKVIEPTYEDVTKIVEPLASFGTKVALYSVPYVWDISLGGRALESLKGGKLGGPTSIGQFAKENWVELALYGAVKGYQGYKYATEPITTQRVLSKSETRNILGEQQIQISNGEETRTLSVYEIKRISTPQVYETITQPRYQKWFGISPTEEQILLRAVQPRTRIIASITPVIDKGEKGYDIISYIPTKSGGKSFIKHTFVNPQASEKELGEQGLQLLDQLEYKYPLKTASEGNLINQGFVRTESSAAPYVRNVNPNVGKQFFVSYIEPTKNPNLFKTYIAGKSMGELSLSKDTTYVQGLIGVDKYTINPEDFSKIFGNSEFALKVTPDMNTGGTLKIMRQFINNPSSFKSDIVDLTSKEGVARLLKEMAGGGANAEQSQLLSSPLKTASKAIQNIPIVVPKNIVVHAPKVVSETVKDISLIIGTSKALAPQKEETVTVENQKSVLFPSSRDILITKNVPETTDKVFPMTHSTVSPKIDQSPSQAQPQIVIQKPAVEVIPDVSPVQVTIPIPPPTRIDTDTRGNKRSNEDLVPFKIDFHPKETTRKKNKRKLNSGFEVQIRKKGRYVPYSTSAYPKNEAIAIGARAVTTGRFAPQATFRIVPSSKPVKVTGIEASGLNNFRVPKRPTAFPTFVQKRNTRIKSPAEINAISLAGARARRSKTPTFISKKSRYNFNILKGGKK